MSAESAFDAFVDHCSKADASERANSQRLLCEMVDLLGVERPKDTHDGGYTFEHPVKILRGDGTSTPGFIDLYRRGCLVLEAKQFVARAEEPTELTTVAEEAGIYTAKRKSGPVRGSGARDDAMMKARGQVERYARSLPADDPSPPFLLLVDVGHSIEVFADFTQAGNAYLPFPDPRSFRIRLEDLRDEAVQRRLRRIWLDPYDLDPARQSAAVTREIAEVLDAATGFGETMLLDVATHTVGPQQFLGIELHPRDAVAEMVLWIGYLQWHFRTRGQSMSEEPVLKKFCNIECRDAVLA